VSGTLLLNVSQEGLSGHTEIIPISASCFIGNNTFDSVQITGLSNCQTATSPNQSIDKDNLIVVFDVQNKCGGKFPVGAIVAIVVVVSLALVAAILIMAVPSLRKKVLPFKDRQNARKRLSSLNNSL